MDSSGRLLTSIVNMTNHIILSREHLHAIRALSTTFIIFIITTSIFITESIIFVISACCEGFH